MGSYRSQQPISGFPLLWMFRRGKTAGFKDVATPSWVPSSGFRILIYPWGGAGWGGVGFSEVWTHLQGPPFSFTLLIWYYKWCQRVPSDLNWIQILYVRTWNLAAAFYLAPSTSPLSLTWRFGVVWHGDSGWFVLVNFMGEMRGEKLGPGPVGMGTLKIPNAVENSNKNRLPHHYPVIV